MVTLASLKNDARALLQRRAALTPTELKGEVRALHNAAKKIGVDATFDLHLRTLFPDVFSTKREPPKKLTNAGHAHNASSGGNVSSALKFHALHAVNGGMKPVEVEASIQNRVPALKTTTQAPLSVEDHFAPLSPAQHKAAMNALVEEIGGVLVQGPGGARITLLEKLESAPGMSDVQKQRVLECLAEVKFCYERAGADLEHLLGGKPGGVTYQDVNWKHTRLEVDRVLDVAIMKGLSPKDTESALLASIFSDSVKTPNNFLVHNVHGAQGALLVLARKKPPMSEGQIEDIVKAALEHQVGPPGFMSMMVGMALTGAGVDKDLASAIEKKIAKPLEHTKSGAIPFTDAEKSALAKVGILAWTVPQEGSRHYGVSRAVIDGDSLVNYACPDGWGKIAMLNGPNTGPYLQSKTFELSLTGEDPTKASAYKSFKDARTIISPEVLPLYDRGLVRTKRALEAVTGELASWVTIQRDVPKTADNKIPYFSAALDYGNARQVAFAVELRKQGVQLMRDKEAL